MAPAVLGALLVVGGVLAVGLPVVAWLDRRQRALVQGPVPDPDAVGAPALGFARPLAEGLKWLAKPDPIPAGAAALAARAAPLLCFVSALALFAVIPFGGRYELGRVSLNLVVADPSWGLLLPLVSIALAGVGLALCGLAGASTESQLGGVRAAVQGVVAAVALGAALLPMWILYGSVQPSVVAAWQDGVFTLNDVAALGGFEAPAAAGWLGLPAWGAILNLPAFLMALTAGMIAVGAAPFDGPRAPDELLGGVEAEVSGARRVLLRSSEHVQTVGVAALLTVVFLGGWAVPWISTKTIAGVVEPLLGEGVANLACLVVQVSAFLAKVAAVVWLQLALRWSLPRYRTDQVLHLCLRVIVPLALVDAFATATIVVALSGAGA